MQFPASNIQFTLKASPCIKERSLLDSKLEITGNHGTRLQNGLNLTSFKIILDFHSQSIQNLTMFKKEPGTDKGEQTQRQIYQAALALFREQGFDATTMQQIAARAEVVKSAAYYYFPGKEAIIQAYYEDVQTRQEEICSDFFARNNHLKERLRTAMMTKFDLAKQDRKLLGVVFRYTGEPSHPLSCLGSGTSEIRRRSTQVFRDAVGSEKLPKDLLVLLPIALWALQMGLLVMFLYDNSSNQTRTRRLAEGSLELTLKLLALAKLPVLKPVRSKFLALLNDAELLPLTAE